MADPRPDPSALRTPRSLDAEPTRLGSPPTAGGFALGTIVDGRFEIAGPGIPGGMGVVYRARHLELKCERALKVLHPHLVADQEAVERFREEAQTTLKLMHPGIVHVFDFGDWAGQKYLVMEWVAGGSLRDLLLKQAQERPRGWILRVLALMKSLIEAVAYAHSKGVLHRDLKPANILLEGDQPKLTDFGIAKLLKPGGAPGSVPPGVGTAYYMAPEQVQGHALALDVRADIYSLGVIFYESVCGHVPIGHFKLPSEVGLPAVLDSFVQRSLAADRADRFASAEDLLAAVRRLTDEVVRTRTEADRARIDELIRKARAHWARGRREEALSAYGEAVMTSDNDAPAEIRQRVARALVEQAECLSAVARRNEAIGVYEDALRRFGDHADPVISADVARALAGHGNALIALERFDAALAAFQELLSLFGATLDPRIREAVAQGLLGKAVSLRLLDRVEEAFTAYRECIRWLETAEGAGLESMRARAFVESGGVLEQLGHLTEALETYDQVLQGFHNQPKGDVGIELSRAIVRKVCVLRALGRQDNALWMCDVALSCPLPLQTKVEVSLQKAEVLRDLGEFREARTVYDGVLKEVGQRREEALAPFIARARVGKGVALDELRDEGSAVDEYRAVIRRFGQSSMSVVQELVTGASVRLARDRAILGTSDEAVSAYDEAIARATAGTDLAHQQWAAHALVEKAELLTDLGRHEGARAAYADVLTRFSGSTDSVLQECVRLAERHVT